MGGFPDLSGLSGIWDSQHLLKAIENSNPARVKQNGVGAPCNCKSVDPQCKRTKNWLAATVSDVGLSLLLSSRVEDEVCEGIGHGAEGMG